MMRANREHVEPTLWGGLFPESRWQELLPDQYSLVFQRLREAGPLSSEEAIYIQRKRIRLGFHEQEKSGAAWTFLRNITLAPKTDLKRAYILSLIVHEAFHLRQSILKRLSMQGELLAWQHQERSYFELTGRRIGGVNQAYPNTRQYWDELMQLSPYSREDLERAQDLTQSIAPSYRSFCLPLYPLHREAGYFLIRGRFKDIYHTFRNLINCK